MSDNPVETEYYLRIISMYIDLGTKSVLNVLYYCKPKEDVRSFLLHPTSRKILDKLRLDNVLQPKEYRLVTSTDLDPEKFDIVLLIKLLSTSFPVSVLPPPRNGWRNPPGKSDLSIAADLLRLRKIRNSVLCHRPKAQLSEFYFKHYWAELEEILLRISQQINPDEVIALNGRLQEYKRRDLGAYDGSEYADLLEDWGNEINEIQTQVEELLEATKEFEAYFKDKPGRYERYVRLMVGGGKLILSAILDRELKRQGLSLAKLLEQKAEYLKNVVSDKHSIACLYSKDIADWDISLIAKVIRHGFEDLKSEDIEEIEAIQSARNNYADTAFLSLDSDSLADRHGDLIGSLKSLSRGLSKEMRTKLGEIIEMCKNLNEDSRTQETYLDSLRLGGSTIRSLADVHTETISKLKRCLKQMKRDGIDLRRNHRLELKLRTVDKNGEKAGKTEDDIFNILKEAIENAVDSNGLPTVRHEIDEILNWIGANDGVIKIDTFKHCIIISMVCSTPSGILHAIEICESKVFEQALSNISSELTSELVETVTVNGNFTLESLGAILLDQSENCEEDQGIAIPITISSADELYRLLPLFESRRLTRSLSSRRGELLPIQISYEFKDSDLSSPDSDDKISGKNQPGNDQVTQQTTLLKEPGFEVATKDSSLQNKEQETEIYHAMEKNLVFSTYGKQLHTLSTKLDTLAMNFGHGATIRPKIEYMSSNILFAAKCLKTTITNAGSKVLVHNLLRMTSLPPGDVRNIQRSLRDGKSALKENKQTFIDLQNDVLRSIESCRALMEVDEFDMKHLRHDIEVLEQHNQIKVAAAVCWGLAAAAAGFLFVRGRDGDVAATAVAGIIGVISIPYAARRIHDEVEKKRHQIKLLKSQKVKLDHQKASWESEFMPVKSDIDKLYMEASQVLLQVADLLRASIHDIGIVITAFEDMETECSKALLQIQALKSPRTGKQENIIMDQLKKKWAHLEAVLLEHDAKSVSV